MIEFRETNGGWCHHIWPHSYSIEHDNSVVDYFTMAVIILTGRVHNNGRSNKWRWIRYYHMRTFYFLWYKNCWYFWQERSLIPGCITFATTTKIIPYYRINNSCFWFWYLVMTTTDVDKEDHLWKRVLINSVIRPLWYHNTSSHQHPTLQQTMKIITPYRN